MNTKALQKLSYGLYLVCSGKGAEFNGQIANTVFQITAEPPTIAVSINKSNLTHGFIEESRVFTTSVLCQSTPLSFIGRFGFKSGRDTNKLDGVDYKIGETGVPVVLENAVAYFEAKVTQEMDVGKKRSSWVAKIRPLIGLNDNRLGAYAFISTKNCR